MLKADKGQSVNLSGKGLSIAVVQARFNAGITDRMTQICRAELIQMGMKERDFKLITVPGALEVPIALKALADSDDYDALIAIGCIIRGETYHFELVANESGSGVTRVSLDYGIPIANAILTVEDMVQAEARVEEKARDAARVAIEMANLLEELT